MEVGNYKGIQEFFIKGNGSIVGSVEPLFQKSLIFVPYCHILYCLSFKSLTDQDVRPNDKRIALKELIKHCFVIQNNLI